MLASLDHVRYSCLRRRTAADAVVAPRSRSRTARNGRELVGQLNVLRRPSAAAQRVAAAAVDGAIQSSVHSNARGYCARYAASGHRSRPVFAGTLRSGGAAAPAADAVTPNLSRQGRCAERFQFHHWPLVSSASSMQVIGGAASAQDRARSTTVHGSPNSGGTGNCAGSGVFVQIIFTGNARFVSCHLLKRFLCSCRLAFDLVVGLSR